MCLARKRIEHYTSPFFVNSVHSTLFFYQLEDRRAWIVGSVALAALSFSCDLVVPDNLNVISSVLTETAWITCMRDHLGYSLIREQCGGFYKKLATGRLIFSHKEIEVRCSPDPFIMPLISLMLAAQNHYRNHFARCGNIRAVPSCSHYADGECDFGSGVDIHLCGFNV
jgi:hypothetical protein